MTDASTGRIPNSLTFPPLLIAPLAWLVLAGPAALIDSLAGLLLCGLIPYLLFRRGAMGGGDVKLFAALGAIGGWYLGLEIQLGAFIVTSYAALLKLTWQGQLWRTLTHTFEIAIAILRPHRQVRIESCPSEMRMGIPIFIVCCLVLALRHPTWWL